MITDVHYQTALDIYLLFMQMDYLDMQILQLEVAYDNTFEF